MTTASVDVPLFDRDAVELVRRPPPALAPFNEAGVLAPVDVHTAATLARLAEDLGGTVSDEALLAMALAVRAPRMGHACVDLATVAEVVAADAPQRPGAAAPDGEPVLGGTEVIDLPWPNDPGAWAATLRDTRVAPPVRAGGDEESLDDAPLRVQGTRVYLDRHLRDEQAVARRLRELAGRSGVAGDPEAGALVEPLLDTVLAGAADRQRAACHLSFDGGLTVVAGGPGTGKTYTITRLVAAQIELAHRLGRPLPRIALVAPTGKAAARMDAAVREGAVDLEIAPETRTHLHSLGTSTIHRLLGRAVGSLTRPRHDAAAPLDVDLVVVDETSMVPLALMARLLAALPADARLVLVGDPDQLESVEAGTVLGDVIGSGEAGADGPVRGRVVTLDLVRRFGADSGIARLAAAIRSGDDDAVVDALDAAPDGDVPDVVWLRTEHAPTVASVDEGAPGVVRDLVVAAGTDVVRAALAGDAAAATAASGTVQVLCAHRRGPTGVQGWNRQIERWLAAAHPDLFNLHGASGAWYAGRPVLLTRNDHRRELYNGDSGVVVPRSPEDGDADDEPVPYVAFATTGTVREVAANRIGDLETAWAMTIHKSQGSQFDHVIVVLPDAGSRLLTRELLYTAVTRARTRVTVAGSEAALRAAVRRRVERIGGLRDALWSTTAP